jgi:hypothetical protein
MILALGGITVVSILLFIYVQTCNSILCSKMDLLKERLRAAEHISGALEETRGAWEREMLLKRALEDLAFSEIDRARFALEVVYGENR